MAEFQVSELCIDGERVPFGNATLRTVDGTLAQTWELTLQAAHMLRRDPRQRVRLWMRTQHAGDLEGFATVRVSGHRDRETELYYGVELEGLDELHEASPGCGPQRPAS
ncbi:MAG: hypothetical protein IBX62_02030 [Coriobacteriia bacterium]|nr:hypothetical protein [Coriobacteriia bacterium]